MAFRKSQPERGQCQTSAEDQYAEPGDGVRQTEQAPDGWRSGSNKTASHQCQGPWSRQGIAMGLKQGGAGQQEACWQCGGEQGQAAQKQFPDCTK